jgi:hypothetical protein
MWIDFVELAWEENGQEGHFSFGMTIDDAQEIVNKGSLEDRHAEIIVAAAKYLVEKDTPFFRDTNKDEE